MGTEKRLIDARYLTSQMYLICEACQTENISIDAIIDEIDNAPDVDAVEVVHGWWLSLEEYSKKIGADVEDDPCSGWIYCSECGQPSRSFNNWNYCPNCGAKMDGDGNGT